MARKSWPGAARQAVGREAAELRRSAPGGKRFVGDRAGRSRSARRAQAERVERMAEEHRAEERAAASLPGLAASVLVDSLRLAAAILAVPLRLAQAMRRARQARAEA